MTLAEYSLTAFALLNGARIAAYLPQLRRVYHDPNGASAVSIVTWTLFASANIATVAYALVVAGDRLVALIFALNTIGCASIALMTTLKRMKALPVDRVIHPSSSGKVSRCVRFTPKPTDAWPKEVRKRLQDRDLCRFRLHQWE
jgi:hypothetical protein